LFDFHVKLLSEANKKSFCLRGFNENSIFSLCK
jgi:hypothetical protein